MELNLCMRCMNELPADGTVCPVCGFDASGQEPASHHLPFGSVLAGRYMTGAVLGEGGFGVTYIGYELNLGIRIAIKEFYPYGFVGRDHTQSLSVYSRTNAEDFFAKGKEKFLQEARGIAQFMKLPGIVAVRDFFLENNTAYIVMDYIEGPSLKEYARSLGGKIGASELLEMMRPIVQSLIEVHARGVIHRDISPDNILVDTEGKAWLIDFGAMRDASPDGERTLSVTLKKGYSPEEQYRTHGEQGPWTDVYSMCATIYAMTTGIKPDEPYDRMEAETLKPPRASGVDLTPVQEETLIKGLAIRKKDRLQSMEDLYNGLYTARAMARVQDVAEKTGETESKKNNTEISEKTGEAEKKKNITEATEKTGTGPGKQKSGIRALLVLLVLLVLLTLGGFFGYRYFDKMNHELHLEEEVVFRETFYGFGKTPYQIGENVIDRLSSVMPDGYTIEAYLIDGKPVRSYRVDVNKLQDVTADGYDAEDRQLMITYKYKNYMYDAHLRLAVARPKVVWNWRNVFAEPENEKDSDNVAGRGLFSVENADYLSIDYYRPGGAFAVTVSYDNRHVVTSTCRLKDWRLAEGLEQYWIGKNELKGYSEENRAVSEWILKNYLISQWDNGGSDAVEAYLDEHVSGELNRYWGVYVTSVTGQGGAKKALEQVLKQIEENRQGDARDALSRAVSIGATSVYVSEQLSGSEGSTYYCVAVFARY